MGPNSEHEFQVQFKLAKAKI